MVYARFEQLQETQIIEDYQKLKQGGNYTEYVDKFEELKEHVRLLNGDTQPESYYISGFLSGLNDELKSAVKMFKPTTLQAAYDLGRDQSATIETITRKLKGNTRSFTPAPNSNTNKGVTQNHTTPPKGPFKMLTQLEMSAKREKGLCFNCDEKFVPDHKCKQKISYMILSEDEELAYLQTHTTTEGGDKIEVEEILMTINAINGSDSITTMKFTGAYEGHKLEILIDSRSTLSFSRESTAHKLGKVANG